MDSSRTRVGYTQKLWDNTFNTISNTITHLKPTFRLAELRQASGLTQLEVAQLLEVTENTYGNWERGRSGLEAVKRIIKLCKLFSCSVEDLLTYEGVWP